MKKELNVKPSKALSAKVKNLSYPVFVQKGEDGFYLVSCPIFDGCFTQGKTVDEALKNIKEVIELCLEEKDAQETVRHSFPKEMSFHTVTLA